MLQYTILALRPDRATISLALKISLSHIGKSLQSEQHNSQESIGSRMAKSRKFID